jgi:hypothetical protein
MAVFGGNDKQQAAAGLQGAESCADTAAVQTHSARHRFAFVAEAGDGVTSEKRIALKTQYFLQSLG